MDAMVTKIVGNFVEKGIVSKKNKNIYEFGIKQGIVIIINLITILLIGLISGELWNLTIFTISYLPLRSYAGGYHAESELGCYIFSTLMIIAVVFASKFIVLDFHIVVVILGLAVSVLMLFAPLEDHRKPLDEMEVKVYRRKLRGRLLVEILIITIGMYYWNGLFGMVVIAILAIALMVLFGWINKKRRVTR